MGIHFINSAKLVETNKNVTEHPGAVPGRSTILDPNRSDSLFLWIFLLIYKKHK